MVNELKQMRRFRKVNLQERSQLPLNKNLVRKKRESFFQRKKRLRNLYSRVIEKSLYIKGLALKKKIGLRKDIRFKKGLFFFKFFLNHFFFNLVFKGTRKKFNFKKRNKFLFFWYSNYFRFFIRILKFKRFKKKFYRDLLKNQISKYKYFSFRRKFGDKMSLFLSSFLLDQFNLLNINNNFFKKVSFYVLKKKISLNIFELNNELCFDLSFKRRNYYITFYNFSTGRTILNISAGCSYVNTFLNRRRFFTFGVFKDCFKRLWRFGWNKRLSDSYLFKSFNFENVPDKYKKVRGFSRSKFLFFYRKSLEIDSNLKAFRRDRKWLVKMLKQNRYKNVVYVQAKIRLHCNSPFKSKSFYNFIKNYVEKNYRWARYYFVCLNGYIDFEYLIKYRKLRLKNKRRI